MKCSDYQELLVEYLHRELEPDVRIQVAKHLGGCGECAKACCRLQSELEDLSSALTETPRPELRRTIRAELADHFSPPWWKRMLAYSWQPVPAYGAAVLAVLPCIALIAALRWSTGVDDRGRPSASERGPMAVESGDARPDPATKNISVDNYDASQTPMHANLVF